MNAYRLISFVFDLCQVVKDKGNNHQRCTSTLVGFVICLLDPGRIASTKHSQLRGWARTSENSTVTGDAPLLLQVLPSRRPPCHPHSSTVSTIHDVDRHSVIHGSSHVFTLLPYDVLDPVLDRAICSCLFTRSAICLI